jgi:hypothetical protein
LTPGRKKARARRAGFQGFMLAKYSTKGKPIKAAMITA